MLTIGSLGLAALLVGLWLLPPQLALDGPRAIDGILSQIPVTLPSAVLMLVAVAINIGTAGLLLGRVLPAGRRSLATRALAPRALAPRLPSAALAPDRRAAR